jgi:hypothetical protein
MRLSLVRFAYMPDRTLGVLQINGTGIHLATLERPWIPNALGPGGKPRESCVPDALYRLEPYSSARWRDVYVLINGAVGVWRHLTDRPKGELWGRSEILIHAANTVEQIVGCIAVGTKHGETSDQLGVLRSRDAMTLLRQALGTNRHDLEIRPVSGTRERLERQRGPGFI